MLDLPRLKQLSLYGNRIHEMPRVPQGGAGWTCLTHLCFAQNRLGILAMDSLAGAAALQTLDLSFNRITHLEGGAIWPPRLAILRMNHNSLRELRLEGATALRHLDVADNADLSSRGLLLGGAGYSCRWSPQLSRLELGCETVPRGATAAEALKCFLRSAAALRVLGVRGVLRDPVAVAALLESLPE